MPHIKDIALVQMGVSFRARIEPEADGTVALIQMRDLTADKLTHRNLITIKMNGLDRHLVKRNDLIFRSRGQTTTAAIIDAEIGPAVVAAPLLRVRVTSKRVLPQYLCWFVNQAPAQAFLHSRATGTAMTMIGKAALNALQVPLPALATQERIVALANLANEEQRLLRALAEKKEKLVRGIQMRWATEVSADERRLNRGEP